MGFIDKIKEKIKQKEKPAINEVVVEKEKSINVSSLIKEGRIAYDFQRVNIAMVKHADPNYSKFGKTDECEFVPEPENEYDKKAIKVMCNKQFLGYIYKGKIQDMIHDWWKKGDPIRATIQTINLEENTISLYVAFYRDPFEGIEKYESLRTKLTKTSKKIDEYTNRQDACTFLERGDKLDLEFDDESETYVVLNVLVEEVGEINKSISTKIKEREDVGEPICLVEETTEDDNGKCGANVLIYFK